MRDGVCAFSFRTLSNFKLYLGKLRKGGVVGERIGWGHPPCGFRPVNGLRRGGAPIEVRAYQCAVGVGEAEGEEVYGAEVLHVGKRENLRCTVGGRIDGIFMRKLLRRIEIVNLSSQPQASHIFILAADHPDGVIVVTIDRVQRFHGALGTEIAAAGTQIVVVQMPDQRRPCVVEHPLDDAGRLIFVAAVGFVHRAHTLVSLQLRLEGEIFHAIRFSVAIGQCTAEDLDGFESSPAGVIVPGVVDGPHVIFSHHAADTLDRRNRGSHAGFGIEAVGTAAATGVALLAVRLALQAVLLPIAGSYVLIGPGHFDTAISGNAGGLAGYRGDDGIWPQKLFFNIEIHLFDVWWWGVVASVEPHDKAGMAAQAVDLIAQRLLRNFKVLRFPPRPALPVIATAPSGHDQDSLMVGEVKEFLSFELAFKTNRVQSHIADVAELVVQALRVFAEHQVGGPAAATDQDVLAVNMEGTPAGRIHFGSYLANAELSLGPIARGAVDVELQVQRVKIRVAHLRGPPQPRIRKNKLRKLVRGESDVFRFVGGKFDVLLECDVLNLAFQFAVDRMACAVLQLSGDGETRGIGAGQV